MVKPSKEHEDGLTDYIRELQYQGYNVVRTCRKIPDAIATKDGKIFAVEMMGKRHIQGAGWKRNHTKKEKEIAYSNFDGILYREFKYPVKDRLLEGAHFH